MKTNIILTKIWSDDFSAEFNIKFMTTLNYENFVVSGNYFATKENLKDLANLLNKTSGSVVFGSKKSNDYCELTVSQSERGYKNINYRLVKNGESDEFIDKIDMSLNTGYIIEPAIIDRIVPKLDEFYDESDGSQISLVNTEN